MGQGGMGMRVEKGCVSLELLCRLSPRRRDVGRRLTSSSGRRFDTQDGLYDLAWSEIHENQIATGSGDGSVKLWDTMLNVRLPSLACRCCLQNGSPTASGTRGGLAYRLCTGFSDSEMARTPAGSLQRRLEQHAEGALLHEQLGRHDQDCAFLAASMPFELILTLPLARSGRPTAPPRYKRSPLTPPASTPLSSLPPNPLSSPPVPPTAPSNSGTRDPLSLLLSPLHLANPPSRLHN